MADTRTLIASGYRIVSRKFRIAARVDRPDWQEFCAKHGHPVDPDWYRRILSRDTVTVTPKQVHEIPNSGHDKTGYVEVFRG